MRRPKNMWVSEEFDREVSMLQDKYRRQYKDITKVQITKEVAEMLKRKRI
jgi:hypothetical protein